MNKQQEIIDTVIDTKPTDANCVGELELQD